MLNTCITHSLYTCSMLDISANVIWPGRTKQLWLWWHGSWIYNYLCHQCLSPLALWIRIPLMARYAQYTTLCDQVRQQLSVCRWFSSTNKTDRHYITEILLKVALSKITPNAGRMENLNIENLKRQKHAKSYSSELSKPF